MIQLKTFFAVVLLCIPMLSEAQEEGLLLMERMKLCGGKAKIDMLNELSVIYRKTERYKAMDFARQAYRLSVEGNYPAGRALAKKNEGICWFFIGRNDSAGLCYKEALEVFTGIGDKKGISACYNNLGLIAQETGHYDEAIEKYQLSIDMDHKLGDETGVAQTMENVADIYMYQGKAKRALLVTNQCMAIYFKQSYKPGLLASYSNRAAEYDYLMQFGESIRDYTKALQIAVELHDKYQEIMINSNLGVTYWHMGKTKTALSYLNLALGMSDENDDGYNIDNTLKTMAQIYTSQKQYEKANEILAKILKRNDEKGNKRQVAVIMTSMGRNLMELNEIDKASAYLNKSLEITIGLNAPYEMLENFRNLALVNAILHNFKAADSLQDRFAKTYSELNSSDTSVVTTKVNSVYNERIKPATSSVSNWIIAFLLFALIVTISGFTYQGTKKEG